MEEKNMSLIEFSLYCLEPQERVWATGFDDLQGKTFLNPLVEGMFWIVLDIKVILANMVFSQVLRIIFFTFLTFFLPLSCTEIKLVWRLCRQKHLAAYWKWEIKIKKIINIYHCLLKKSFCVKSLTICIHISHQASQRTGNTLKIDLYTCSQSYFLWTLSSTFKVISIFHYKLWCSKIQFCPLYASTTKTIQTWLNCSFKSPLCTEASISCKIHTEYVSVF